MSHEYSSCQHLEVIEDYHEGTIVCSNCGVVMSPLFVNQIHNLSHNMVQEKILTEIQHLLDRIHVPICYANQIESYYAKNFTTKSNKSIAFAVYKVLNKLGIPISMKEISNVSCVDKKSLNKAQQDNNFVSIDNNAFIEKYCKILGLSFQTTTVIKNVVKNLPISGHNPSSMIASTIYKVCKEEKRKISIKQISLITNVSSISIQRYNNYSNT